MIKSRKQKGTTASRKRLREDEEQDPGHQTNISTTATTTTTTEENNSNNHDEDSETLQPPLKRMAQKPSSSLHFHTTSKSSKKNSAIDDNDSDDLQQVPTTDFHHQASRDMRCATDQLVTSTNDLLMSDDEANHKNKKKNKGPKKPSANVRFNTQMDHQPGICKDYYETGFCGYGDNCVFAHIREEWKSGWKQDKEWEQLQKKQKKQKQVAEDGGENDSSDKKNNEKDDDGLPHACFICRQPFVDPVVTVCKHYFCESCALKRFNGGKNPKCAACGAQTNGQFNTARDIIQSSGICTQSTDYETRVNCSLRYFCKLSAFQTRKSSINNDTNEDDARLIITATTTKQHTNEAMTASNSTTTFAHTSNLNGDHRSKGVGGRVSSTSQKIVCRTTTKILEEKLSIANKKIQLLNQSVTKLQLELVHYKQYFASMYLNNSMNHNTASSAVPISIVAPVNMASVEQKIDNYIEQSDDSDPSIAYFEVSCALKVLKSRVKQARTQSISFQPENTACNITRGEFEKLYDCHRIQEFLGSATKILNNRLQPGFAKNGTNLHLGQCPFYLFNYFMSLQSNCKHTTKVFHPIRDGVRVNVTKHYYRFNNTLPDFGSRWHIRDHGNVVDWSAEMRSMYQSIVLIINEEDDRVTCKYSQVSQFKFCDRWIDTA